MAIPLGHDPLKGLPLPATGANSPIRRLPETSRGQPLMRAGPGGAEGAEWTPGQSSASVSSIGL